MVRIKQWLGTARSISSLDFDYKRVRDLIATMLRGDDEELATMEIVFSFRYSS